MKQILFIITDLCGGGAEKALIEMLKAIDYKQYKVSLCLLFYKGVYLNEIPQPVKVISLFKDWNDFYHRKAFKKYKRHNQSWLLSWYMRWKVRGAYDVIISFLEGPSLLYHTFLKDKAKMNISWVHCDLLNYHFSDYYFYRSAQEKEYYAMMDKIVFVSQTAKSNFGKLYNIDVPKYCLHNVIDVDSIKVLADGVALSPQKRLMITSIGSLLKVKGFDRLIRVANMLKSDGYDFCIQIIGIGDEEQKLIELRDELGLQEVVAFLGFKKPPYPYLKQSDLFVSTSLFEGLPLVICEAMALGIPVVATRTAGAMEILGDNLYGVLTDHNDEAIYEGIKYMLNDEQLRNVYAQKGQDSVKRFLPQQIMNEFYKLLK